MKIFKYLIFALLVPLSVFAQIPVPQINLTGNIGCQGFPCVNSGTLVFAADANHTMTVQETSAFNIKVTSSVTLTATRNLVAPTGRFPFTIENATTGGQSIQIIGQSGTGVTIPNGSTVAVWNDGTNFVQIGLSGTGISGMASGQIPVAASPTTIASSIPLAGSGVAVTTGPASSFIGDFATFSSTNGQIQDGYTIATLTTIAWENVPWYWNIQGSLFTTGTMLGPVYLAPFGVTGTVPLRMRQSGTISCSVAPTMNLMDLGISPSTVYSSATSVASLSCGTSDGVCNGTPTGTITAGHYYGVAFSAGTCTTAPAFDIVAKQ